MGVLGWLQANRDLTEPVLNVLLAGLLIILICGIRLPGLSKAWSYGLLREGAKKELDYQTRSWGSMLEQNFQVRYQERNYEDALLVLETAREQYDKVTAFLDYDYQGNIPLVVYPDKSSLNISFGWDSNASAMGVYWAGAIRVLAPTQWAGDPEQKETKEIFMSEGPMAHELTHLLVDYRTRGNYARWLTEGIAQYVEREVTGFQFPVSGLPDRWYGIKQLDRDFDKLPDQSLAYYQSLQLVDFLMTLKGREGLLDLLDALAEGKTMGNALLGTYGLTVRDLEQGFRQYTQSDLSLAG